jgi:hypothetical protein
MWIVVVVLWGVIEPATSVETMNRIARGLRARWHANVKHPFDWAKD